MHAPLPITLVQPRTNHPEISSLQQIPYLSNSLIIANCQHSTDHACAIIERLSANHSRHSSSRSGSSTFSPTRQFWMRAHFRPRRSSKVLPPAVNVQLHGHLGESSRNANREYERTHACVYASLVILSVIPEAKWNSRRASVRVILNWQSFNETLMLMRRGKKGEEKLYNFGRPFGGYSFGSMAASGVSVSVDFETYFWDFDMDKIFFFFN